MFITLLISNTNKQTFANSSNSKAKLVSTFMVPSLTATYAPQSGTALKPLTRGHLSSFANPEICIENHSMLSCSIASSFRTEISVKISCCEMPPSPKLLVNISASRILRCCTCRGLSSSEASKLWRCSFLPCLKRLRCKFFYPQYQVELCLGRLPDKFHDNLLTSSKQFSIAPLRNRVNLVSNVLSPLNISLLER
uniref:Uncharacterized protein n=1 Tax=Glossina palpalis gambiensis TaxID=67801 RepID=A0A1B0C0Y9_9MUSC